MTQTTPKTSSTTSTQPFSTISGAQFSTLSRPETAPKTTSRGATSEKPAPKPAEAQATQETVRKSGATKGGGWWGWTPWGRKNDPLPAPWVRDDVVQMQQFSRMSQGK